MIDNEIVPLALTLKGIVAMSHAEQGFHHVFLHVGTGMFLFLKDLEDSVILVFPRYFGHDSESLHTVVGLALVIRMAVACSCPADAVDSVLEVIHAAAVNPAGDNLSKHVFHIRNRLEGKDVPHVLKQAHVFVVSPVSPVPVAVMPFQEPVFAHLVCLQISLDRRQDIFDGGSVTCVHVVVPEAVHSDGGQHLAWKFLAVAARNRGKENIIRPLPVN